MHQHFVGISTEKQRRHCDDEERGGGNLNNRTTNRKQITTVAMLLRYDELYFVGKSIVGQQSRCSTIFFKTFFSKKKVEKKSKIKCERIDYISCFNTNMLAVSK